VLSLLTAAPQEIPDAHGMASIPINRTASTAVRREDSRTPVSMDERNRKEKSVAPAAGAANQRIQTAPENAMPLMPKPWFRWCDLAS
jgi:hypothetical protein